MKLRLPVQMTLLMLLFLPFFPIVYQGNKNVLRRTNNGLERYNLRLKKLFKSGTPSFAQFVNTMRIEAEDQQKIAQDYMNQAAKRARIDENDGNFIYQPPPCYAKWEPLSKKTEFD